MTHVRTPQQLQPAVEHPDVGQFHIGQLDLESLFSGFEPVTWSFDM
jgi:hypothetical protein